MATLIATFSSIDATRQYVAPVAQGSDVRTESITIPGTGTLAAEGQEELIELLSDADCWVAIGAAPDASVHTAARKITSGQRHAYHVMAGDKVAVEAA